LFWILPFLRPRESNIETEAVDGFGLYFVDIYCRGELGMRTVTEQYKLDYDGPSAEPVRNSFLYGGSVGLAINPSKYFGIFYELTFDNLNKEYKPKIGEIKTKAIHRFGLNVRFPGPKKWQK